MDEIHNPPVVDPEDFLEEVVTFADGSRFQRLKLLYEYRRDPGEARILYLCRRHRLLPNEPNGGVNNDDDLIFVMKIKIQVPPRPASDDPQDPLQGPSETTSAELKALQMFRDDGTEGVPHLVASKCSPQSANGPFPGGYIAYTVMTRMPGRDLMDLRFWSLTDDQRDEIRSAFVKVLKSVWWLGMAPYDCALRNVLWDEKTRQCSIVDFEHYMPAKDPINMHETEEMQRWGLERRPPPSHWAVEWGLIKDPSTR